MAEARKYSDAEVRAILDRALKGEAAGSEASGVSHDDLLAIGEQVGLTREAMSQAAEELLQNRLDQAALGSLQSRRRRWLGLHLGLFTLINGLLFAVNALTTPGEWWVLFPVFFWGLTLALHAGITFGARPSQSALKRERRRSQAAPVGAGQARLRVEAAGVTERAADASPPGNEPETDRRRAHES